jgi:hypothetical protein
MQDKAVDMTVILLDTIGVLVAKTKQMYTHKDQFVSSYSLQKKEREKKNYSN